MGRRPAAPPTSLFKFTAQDAGLVTAVRDLKGRFASGNQAMLRVNLASVEFLKKAASKNLDDKIKRAPDFRNRHRLADVILDESVHSTNVDGFQFLIHERVQAVDQRAASYYRAVESGSNYWPESGRYVALVWRGQPTTPTRGIGTQAAFADRRGARVLITNPVPAYKYATNAVQDFQDRGLYHEYARRELEGVGLKFAVKKT